MENNETGVRILTVKELVKIFKKDEEANNIELLRFKEVGYEIIVGKGLYQEGDKIVYIMPDYCLSDLPIFKSFIEPEKGKSYLGNIDGKPRRVRAKKFNFHAGDGKSLYSNGIALPIEEVEEFIKIELVDLIIKLKADYNKINEYLTKELQVFKYEKPETGSKVGQAAKGGFPKGVYKTDETNINNVWGHIKFPIQLVGTEKVDGSSITIGVTDDYPDGFIASRNINKSFFEKVFAGTRKKTLLEKIMFWKSPDLNVFKEVPSKDMFVVHGLPYLTRIKEIGYKNIIFRGELNGKDAKGSGNKHNPAAKMPTNIQFFNADRMVNGIAVKMTNVEFEDMCDVHIFDSVETLFIQKFNSIEEIKEKCEKTFEYYKTERKELIEGIVLATPDNKLSFKYMNNEYDSKK